MWCCICMGKTNAKYVFSKNPCVFRILNNFFKKTWTKTQSLLEVFITKHCFLQYICCVHRKHENTAASGWKYTFLRVYIGKNEARNARGRGVGALLLLLLFLVKYVRSKTSKNTVFCAIVVLVKEKTLVFTTFWQRQGRKLSKNIATYRFFSERVENTVFCDVFSARGFRCTANTTVFFMFSRPVLKANQPKTVVFTVFWQDNTQKKTMFWNNF